MRETLAVYRKEMKSYLVGPIPYLVVAVFALVATWHVFSRSIFLVLRQASLESLFGFLPILFAIIAPAISMRMWSEEIRGETLETLLTLPVRVRHLVLGKFFAGLTIVAACLVGTFGIAITAAVLGDLDRGPVWGGYFGALLMGGAFLSIGLWLSSRTRNQIVAFLIGLVVCLAWALADGLEVGGGGGPVASFLSSISMTARFRSIARGVIDLRDVVFFVSIIGFFLYLNVESIENRRHA